MKPCADYARLLKTLCISLKKIGAHLMNCEFDFSKKNYRNGGREAESEKNHRNLQPGESYENFVQPCPITISDPGVRKNIFNALSGGQIIVKFNSIVEYEDENSSDQCTRILEYNWQDPEAFNIKNPETCKSLTKTE